MKKLLLSLLALGAAACQSHPAATSLVPQARAATRPPLADSTAAVLALTRHVNLAPAWGNKAPFNTSDAALDGFYGPDSYRISFYFDAVRRDSLRPNVYHFRGRDCYNKVVTPFTGTITVTRLAPLADTVALLDSRTRPAYSAFASFELREDPRARGAGWCQGRAYLDFQLNQRQQPEYPSFEGMDLGLGNPTRGGGLVFRGTWRSNRTGRQFPVAWATDYAVIVPDALRKLGLGERGAEVSPKLAHYGWNTLLENDEWWHDSPTL